MSVEKIDISVDFTDWIYSSDDVIGILIVCATTGVNFNVQVGGQLCIHPKVDGYPVLLGITGSKTNIESFHSSLKRFDDCSRGCGIGQDDNRCSDEYYLEYGLAIDKFIKEFVNRSDNLEYNICPNIKFSFDFERLYEVTEGWWPVLIQYKKDFKNEYFNKKFKGYLYFGNCD